MAQRNRAALQRGEVNACKQRLHGVSFRQADRGKYAEKVYWCENKSGSIVKSGMQTSDSTRVYFYDDNAPKTPAKDMLVRGKCEFEFDNQTPQSISESMKIFRAEYDFVTVMSIDDYMFGGLPHMEVSVK